MNVAAILRQKGRAVTTAHPDMTLLEVISLTPLLLLVLALGFFPLLLMSIQDAAIQGVLGHVLGR